MPWMEALALDFDRGSFSQGRLGPMSEWPTIHSEAIIGYFGATSVSRPFDVSSHIGIYLLIRAATRPMVAPQAPAEPGQGPQRHRSVSAPA